MYSIRYSSLFLLLVVAFGRTTHQIPGAADTQPRARSQFDVQRQKSDTSEIVAGNSRPLVGQVTSSAAASAMFSFSTNAGF